MAKGSLTAADFDSDPAPSGKGTMTSADFDDPKGGLNTSDFDKPVPSARDQYVKAAGQLIAHATLLAKNKASDILDPIGRAADEVSEKYGLKADLPKMDEARKAAGFDTSLTAIASNPIEHSQAIVERLSKAAHEAAIQFGIKPTDEEKTQNPNIAALGPLPMKAMRAFQALIDTSLPEVQELGRWAALKEKPLTDRLNTIISADTKHDRFEDAAIAPTEPISTNESGSIWPGDKGYKENWNGFKESSRFDLAKRALAETGTQIAHGLAETAVAMLNPVTAIEAEAGAKAMGLVASGAGRLAADAVSRVNPEAALRAELSPISKLGERSTARLGKAPEDWTQMDHVHQHVQNQTNAALEGVQERLNPDPKAFQAAVAAADKAGYAEVYRKLHGLPSLGVPVNSRAPAMRLTGPAEAEGGADVPQRPIPTSPSDIAAQTIGSSTLNPDAAAVAKSYPSLYAAATGAQVPKAVEAQFQATMADLASSGVKQGAVIDMLKAGVATGKASFVKLAKLDEALQQAALTEQGAHPQTLQRHAMDAYTAAQRPGETLVAHHMEIEAQKAAVMARATATQDVWDEAHRTLKEAETPITPADATTTPQTTPSKDADAPTPLPGRAEALAHAEAAGVPIEEATEIHRQEAMKEQEAGTLDPAIAQEYADSGDDSFDPAALEESLQPFPMEKAPHEMTWEEFSAQYPGIDKETHQSLVEDGKWEAEKEMRSERAEQLHNAGITAQPAHDLIRKIPIGEKWIKALGLTGEFRDLKGKGLTVKGGADENKVDHAVGRLIEAGLLPEGATVNDMLDLLDQESRKGNKADAEASMVRDGGEPLSVRFKGKDYPVNSMEEASSKWNDLRDAAIREGMGSRDLEESPIVIDSSGRKVGTISWNGKIREEKTVKIKGPDLSAISPAIRDPKSNQTFMGPSHAAIVDAVMAADQPVDVKRRILKVFNDQNEHPDAGFSDVDGKFISRDEAQKKYGFRQSHELDALRDGGDSMVREGFSDEAQGFLFDDQGRTNPAAIEADPEPRPEPKADAAQEGLPLSKEAAKGPVTEPKSSTFPAKQTGDVSDVGQELWANRRNLIGKGIKWEDICDLNSTLKSLEVHKTKVWPRPDYEALIEGGMQPFTAHLIKQVYDTISTKPSVAGTPTDAQFETYVNEVQRVKEAVFSWAKDAGTQKEMLGKMAAQAQARLQRGPVSISSLAVSGSDGLLDRVYPKDPATGARWGRQNMEQNDRVAIIGGRKVADALSMDVEHAIEALKAVDKGWPAPQEAWEKRFKIDEYPAGTKMLSEGKEITTTEKTFAVLGKGWGGRFSRIMADRFKTREEAIAKAKELASPKKGGVDQKRPEIENTSRQGPPVRPAGLNVQPKDLMEQFGFKGVNYGNYTNPEERQVFTNNAYDALMDLSSALNLPPKALSLNGVLGLAYGAQGRGGKFSAAAHFVPGVNEINLTKDAGAGTIAHEWFHALDHYFATQAGDKLAKSQQPYLTAWARTETTMPGLRQEIRKAFVDIMDAMTRRPESTEEYAARHEKIVAKAIHNLDSWLASLRRQIENFKDPTISLERQGPVRANELKQFDLIADALRAGNTGSGTEAIGTGLKSYVSSNVGELRRLYKDVVGRTPSPDDIRAINSNADWVKSLKDVKKTEDRLASAMSDTTYLKEAKGLDAAKSGKQYWTTNWELGARAFESYMIDRLAREAQRNDYLASPQADPAAFKSMGGDWYPRGVERETINKAFDTLVNSLKTRETESGTMIYERESDEQSKAYGPGVDMNAVMKEVQLELDFGGKTGITAKLAADGKIDYRGIEINSIQDVAEVIASRRHPKLEHNNFVLMRQGKVVSHMVFTSGRPNAVLIEQKDFDELKNQMEKTGADTLYTGHNHPSANPTPSDDDKAVNARLRVMFQEKYKGMLTTDGEDFFHTDANGKAVPMKFQTPHENYPVAKGPVFTGASSSEEVVAYASKEAMFGKKHTLLLQDSRARVIAMEHFDMDADVPSSVRDAIVRHGASRAILIAPKVPSSRLTNLPFEVKDVVSIDKDGKASGYQAYRQGESAYGPIQSMRVSEGDVPERIPRYLSRKGMDMADFQKAIAESKIAPGSKITARAVRGVKRGTVGKVLSVGQKEPGLFIQFEGSLVPQAVRPEDLVETNRKPAARVALEEARKAAKVSGEPSLSVKKIITEGQAGLAAGTPSQLTELQALSEKFKNQAKGARIGAREATKVMRAKMDAKIDEFQDKVSKLKDDVKFTKAEAQANADWLKAEQDAIRGEIVDYINGALPVEARGKFLTTVKNADTVSKMLFARQAIDDAVGQLHKKGLLSDIRKLVPRILDSPGVDVKAKQAIREYLSDVELKGRSAATYARLRKTLDFVVGQEAAGLDVDLPKAVVEELDILGRRPLKDMNEVEVEGIFNRLQMLEEIGRKTVKAREALYLLERERISGEILDDLKPIEARQMTEMKGTTPLGRGANVANAVKAAMNSAYDKYLALTPPDVVWDMMSKTTQYGGAAIKYFAHRIGASYARALDGYDAPIQSGRDIIDKFNLDQKTINDVTAYAYMRQPNGEDYLRNLLGMTDEDIKAASTLPIVPGAQELYNHWRNELDEVYPKLADSVRFNDNQEVGRIPNYFPVRFKKDAALDVGEDLAGMIRGLHKGFQKNVGMGNLKRRSGSNRGVSLDGRATFEAYMRLAHYKIAMSRDVRMLSEVVNSKEFAEKAGEFGTRFAKQFMTLMARRGAPRVGDILPRLDNARRAGSVFAIVGRLPTALVHMTLLSNAASISGPGPIFGAFKDVMNEDLHRDSSLEDWWRKNDPSYRQAHGDDPVFMDAIDAGHWISKDWWKALTTPTSLRYIVRKATLSALEGNYREALKKRGIERDLTSPINQDAMNEARLLTRRAIPSTDLPHMFLAYNSGDVLTGNLSVNRVVTQYKNFTIDRWSAYAHDLPEMLKGERYADAANFFFWQTSSDFVEVGIRHGYKLALAGILGAGAAYAIDDEKDSREFWTELLMKTLEKPPFVPDILNSIVYGRVPTATASLAYDGLVAKPHDMLRAHELGQNRKFYQSMAEDIVAIASLAGVPIPFGGTIEQIMRMVLSDGGVRFPYADERTRLNNFSKDGTATDEDLQRRAVLNHAFSRFEKLNHNYKQAMKDGRKGDAAEILQGMKEVSTGAKR